MTSTEKWIVGTLAGAVVSAFLQPIVNDWFEQFRCPHCRAWLVRGANGPQCPNGHVSIALPYRVADTDTLIPNVYGTEFYPN